MMRALQSTGREVHRNTYLDDRGQQRQGMILSVTFESDDEPALAAEKFSLEKAIRRVHRNAAIVTDITE
jgi:arginyl-tRNA synthetase